MLVSRLPSSKVVKSLQERIREISLTDEMTPAYDSCQSVLLMVSATSGRRNHGRGLKWVTPTPAGRSYQNDQMWGINKQETTQQIRFSGMPTLRKSEKR
jgi:hypothetical protein